MDFNGNFDKDPDITRLDQKTQNITSTGGSTQINSDDVELICSDYISLDAPAIVLAGVVTSGVDGTGTLGTVTKKWANIHTNDLSVGDFDVKQAMTSLQYLTGDEVEVKYPLEPLTDNTRMKFSSSITDESKGKETDSFRMFDNIYFVNAHSVVDFPNYGGWISSDINTTFLSIDGEDVYGDYNILDLFKDTSTAIITSFQFYCAFNTFPIKYQIVGSNDNSKWTSIYATDEAVVDGRYNHAGTSNGAFTAKTYITKRNIHFRYVGILVETHKTGGTQDGSHVQELLLYGAEPSKTINVVKKIEEVVRGPDIKSLIQEYIYAIFEIFNKRNGLTDGALVSTSGNQSGGKGGFLVFNGIYGVDIDGEYSGWASDNTKGEITIDGNEESGYYVYVDLSSKPIIKSFQLWAPYFGKPRDFYILGSDDETSWTKLYDSLDTEKFTNTLIGSTLTQHKEYTDIIPLDNNTHYNHICLFVLTAVQGEDSINRTACQEFRLFTV
jgi:hypothetical protein